jgi:hypothetical protein
MAGVPQPFRLSWSIPFWGSPSTDATFPDNYRIGKEEMLDTKSATVEFSVHDPYEGDYRYGEKEMQLVVEVPVVYETWKVALKEALQGMLVTLNNTSNYSLQLVSCETSHGVWSLVPPSVVPPKSSHDFGAESHGITGSAGKLTYIFETSDTQQTTEEEEEEAVKTPLEVYFCWEIPVFGAPEYSSNYFRIEPKLLGAQCEITLKLGTEETFMLEKADKVRPYSIHSHTSYGFENST